MALSKRTITPALKITPLKSSQTSRTALTPFYQNKQVPFQGVEKGSIKNLRMQKIQERQIKPVIPKTVLSAASNQLPTTLYSAAKKINTPILNSGAKISAVKNMTRNQPTNFLRTTSKVK